MKFFKRIMTVALVLVMALSFTACEPKAVVESDTELGIAINETGKYLAKKVKEPKYGQEDVITSLLRSGYINYWDDRATKYRQSMNTFIKSNGYHLGKKGDVYFEAYPDVIFSYTACGIYADRTSSQDLTWGISFDDWVLRGGYYNKIRALLAFECGGHGTNEYHTFDGGDLNRENLTAFVLGLQADDGRFTFSGHTESDIKITATAVTALALGADNSEKVSKAIDAGIAYLKDTIKTTDTIDDLQWTVVALNTTGLDATDVNGKNLIDGIMSHQLDDGSFSEDTSAKKGNEHDTAAALIALASQHRFVNGETSYYDMSDIIGGTHNKLSPLWTAYVNFMKYALGAVVAAVLALYVISRKRIKQWKADGTYDEKRGTRILSAEATAEEVAAALKERNKNDYFASEREDEPEAVETETTESVEEVTDIVEESAEATEVTEEKTEE